jgi:hypothetical protein
MPRQRMHWLMFIDADDEQLVDRIKRAIEPMTGAFASFRMFVTNEPSLASSKDFTKRGMRIARNLRTCINEANRWRNKTPFLFMTEDDTLVPRDAFTKLYKQITSDDKLAYVSGVEPSRGSDLHIGMAILGTVGGHIVHRVNPPYQRKGIVNINSGGWYCWIGRVDALYGLTFRCIEDGRFLGPDALMVFDLVNRGWKATADWSIACHHWCPVRGYWLTPAHCVGWEITYEPTDARTARRGKKWKADMRKIKTYSYQ